MTKIITDYLEESAKKFPDKTAYVDVYGEITYRELKHKSYQIAYQLMEKGCNGCGVAICLEKSIRCVITMLGVLYSGNYYTVIDMGMPSERIRKIMDVFSPPILIVDEKSKAKFMQLQECSEIISVEDLFNIEYQAIAVRKRCGNIKDSDLSQVLFTSGSTGVPKGVALSHRSVIYATESRTKCLGYCGSDIFANQFPFYFVGHIADVFCTLKNGATDYIIPRQWFSSPKQLIEFMKEKKITVLDWIAPALGLIARYGALSEETLPDIKTVVFGGEPLPIKYLQMWEKALPNADFFNAYGSTELNGIVFHRVDQNREYKGQLPLGFPVEEAEIFLVDENGKRNKYRGELHIKSKQLAAGYYRNEEETKKRFLITEEKNGEETVVFKTGDLVEFDELGELIYLGRKDFQIKRHGFRIELGEIEYAANKVAEVEEAACLYDREKERIVLFYSGHITDSELKNRIKETIPRYMLPEHYVEMSQFPKNINGKTDRDRLMSYIRQGKTNG